MLNKKIAGKIKLIVSRIGLLYNLVREAYYFREYQKLKKNLF